MHLAHPVALPKARALFARTDDGAGGRIQTLKRRFKFRLRYWRHHVHMQRIASTLHLHGLDALLESDPQLLMRPLRSYLWNRLAAPDRARATMVHLHWLVGHHHRDTLLALYRVGHSTAARFVIEEREVRFDLEPGRRLGREGELELHLRLDGQTVLRCAFSILPGYLLGEPDAGRLMVIGNMQGGDYQGPELVRELTQLMHRTRPRTLLLTALQGLAQGWDLDGLRGVCGSAHSYAAYRGLSKRVMVDYDELWQDLGATQKISCHWQLERDLHLRPAEEVPSKKRAEHRRRNALRAEIAEHCAHSARRGFEAAVPAQPLAATATPA